MFNTFLKSSHTSLRYPEIKLNLLNEEYKINKDSKYLHIVEERQSVPFIVRKTLLQEDVFTTILELENNNGQTAELTFSKDEKLMNELLKMKLVNFYVLKKEEMKYYNDFVISLSFYNEIDTNHYLQVACFSFGEYYYQVLVYNINDEKYTLLEIIENVFNMEEK